MKIQVKFTSGKNFEKINLTRLIVNVFHQGQIIFRLSEMTRGSIWKRSVYFKIEKTPV